MDFISHITVLADTTTSTLTPNFISSTNNGPAKILSDYISAFGGIIIAFAIIMTGIKILLSINKKDVRERAMDALGKIIVGGFIIGASLVLSGFIANIANQTGIEITSNIPSGTKSGTFEKNSEDSTFVTRAIADVLDAVPNKIFEWVTTKDDKGNVGVMGFKSLDKLVFNASDKDTSMPPFTNEEWHNLNYLYICICTIVAPLLLIMIAKTGIEMVIYSDSTAKKIDLKEEIMRWFICAFLLGTAPFLVQGLFSFFNTFTDSLGTATQPIWGKGGTSATAAGSGFSVDTFKNLATGSIIVTALIHVLYAWVLIKINLVFISRGVVLAVMYAFTPIAIALWGINKKVNAASIWFGEMITNAAMQFCYAFTFTVMLVALGKDAWNSWFIVIVWMSAIIKIADMLRNSLQGLFTKLAGIDEASLAGGAFGSVGSTFAGMAAAFGMATANTEFKAPKFGGGGSFKDSNKNNQNETSNNIPSSNDGSGNIDVNKKNNSNNSGRSPASPDVESPNGTSRGDTGINVTDEENPEGKMPPITPQNGSNAEVPPVTPQDGSYTDVTGEENPEGEVPPIAPQDSSNADVTNEESPEDKVVSDYKKNSNEQALYNSTLADNVNKKMANRGNLASKVSGAMSAASVHDPILKGFIQGTGNIVGGVQNRIATFKAVKSTVDQMQQLSGMNESGKYNMDKKEALSKLFGGNNDVHADFKTLKVLNNPLNKVLDATANTSKGKTFRTFMNTQSFISNVSKGNNEKATTILKDAHPFNNLNDEDKTTVIKKTNSYTSMDGFNHWND